MRFKIWKIRYLPSTIFNLISIKRRHVSVAQGTRIFGKVIFKGSGRIEIGENCLINSSLHADPIGGDQSMILRADKIGKIIIGNNCGLSNCAIVSQNEIIIHDHVFVGAGVKIYDTDFHSINMIERTTGKNEHVKTAPIEIREGAFIGAHSLVLKGVIIGNNAVIGAGSVVTKNVPANEIWAGNPARKIGESE